MIASISHPQTAARQAELFGMPAPAAARALIGWTLTLDGVGGRIVETEAYQRDDPASHSVSGPTLRNAAMFGPVGRAYVYRSYGVHWCLNLVCGQEPGSAVLIRALEPLVGLDVMQARRGLAEPRRLCSGPGRLCQALAVTGAHDGLRVGAPPFDLTPPDQAQVDLVQIVEGPRIGISKAVDLPWRFGASGSGYLSRSFR